MVYIQQGWTVGAVLAKGFYIFQIVVNVIDKGLLNTGQSPCVLLGSNEIADRLLMLFLCQGTLFPPDFLAPISSSRSDTE